ncbi:MAG: DMT family transporter [Bacteroidota bacterium]
MNSKKGLVAGLLAVMGWGSAGLFIKLLPTISPLWIAAGRSGVAALAIAVLIIILKKSEAFKNALRLRPIWELGLYVSAYYLFAVMAYQYASVAEAALLLSSSPLFVFGINLLQKKVPSRKEKVAVSLAVLGTLLIFLPKLLEPSQKEETHFQGLIYALLSSALIAVFSIRMNRLGSEKHDIFAINFIGFFFLTLPLGFGWIDESASNEIAQLGTYDALKFLLALGVWSTAIASIFYSIASIKLTPVIITSLRFLTPIIAAILASLILGENVPWTVWPSGCLILGGLALLTLKKPLFH